MAWVSRREFLVSMLGAPLAASLASTSGCDEPVAPHVAGRILGPSMRAGHLLRDARALAALRALSPDTGARSRRVRVAILGGGPSGLGAAWQLDRLGVRDYVVVELEDEAGGTSVFGESGVTRYPWGAHYVPLPRADNAHLVTLLAEMGAIAGTDDRGEPIGAEEVLVREPDERVFYRGFWYPGLYLDVGATARDRADFARFVEIVRRYGAMRDARGRRAFAIPVDLSSDDTDLVALDRTTARDWMDREGLRSPRLRWLVDYACRDDYGLRLEDASAWAALFYWAARVTPDAEVGALDTQELLAWPEGNGAIVRHLARRVGERRLQMGKLAIDVAEGAGGEGPARVRIVDPRTRRPETIEADRVIVALPKHVAKHVVRALREDATVRAHLERFSYGAWMVANLHLRGRPEERGHPPAWDNVLYESPSLGYVSATHQRGRDSGPTVWTYYLPVTAGTPRRARERLLEPSWEDWRELVVRDLRRAHPDLERQLVRLDVWRWGHAMIEPRPGFVWSPERARARVPIGRVHFAHSDLSGVALFEEAFHQGVRAASEVASALVDGGGPR